MELIVIGSSGTVGGLLTAELKRQGHRVRALSRATGFDLEKPETWPEAFEGAQRAFYLTPREVGRPQALGASVFEALRRAGVERVVNLTGLGVDRAPASPLRQLEYALEGSGLAFTHVRPNYFMQNFCTGAALRDLVERGEVAMAAGDARVSYVDARDLAEVCAAALTREGFTGRGLDLTGPAGLTHAELAATLARAAGRAIHYRALSDAEARARLVADGVPDERIAARLGFLALVRAGAFAAVSPHVEEVLGRPGRAFEVFARDFASLWQGRAA